MLNTYRWILKIATQTNILDSDSDLNNYYSTKLQALSPLRLCSYSHSRSLASFLLTYVATRCQKEFSLVGLGDSSFSHSS